MALSVTRCPSTWADSDELKATDTKPGASAVRKWSTGSAGSTYDLNESDGEIGTLASVRTLIPSRSASMPGEEFYCVATTVVVGTDPIEAKAAERPE